MFKFLAVTGLFTSLVLGETQPESLIGKNLTLPSRNRRIVDGKEIQIEKIPWHASVLYMKIGNPGENKCSGAIITPYWIVTAAHCICNPDKTLKSDRYVSTGSSHWHRSPVRKIVKKICHPDYEYRESYGSTINDLAVIKIVKPLKFDDKQNFIEMYEKPKSTLDNRMAIAIGWGAIDSRATKYSDYVRYGKVQIMERRECDVFLKRQYRDRAIPEGQFCVKSVGQGIPCDGDSGGSIIVDDTLVGVVSWISGEFCGQPGKPVVCTDIAHYRHWILTIIDEDRKNVDPFFYKKL